jgi:hypothetical protein
MSQFWRLVWLHFLHQAGVEEVMVLLAGETESGVARPVLPAGRPENRNERWFREMMREGHNRRPGRMRRMKEWRARRSRRFWRRVARWYAEAYDTAA